LLDAAAAQRSEIDHDADPRQFAGRYLLPNGAEVIGTQSVEPVHPFFVIASESAAPPDFSPDILADELTLFAAVQCQRPPKYPDTFETQIVGSEQRAPSSATGFALRRVLRQLPLQPRHFFRKLQCQLRRPHQRRAQVCGRPPGATSVRLPGDIASGALRTIALH
jgi:hypothetical protein